uniref:Uncharacterized protein n=1 Tax=Eutreptiella gymnastica TaxID=73025 RepID=A0A7S4FWQ3_9EUGL|mmetsp:Transcript_82396/g.137789  ORF Transcript_82396/g.137789 Transcript_82396/m.137789 type:complete len:188 (+) Transcript_82396:55-618(+)|eukprot:CAMPEP_0174367848 /NCGR_PEP_ID=MMETSP0811_2-20130205/86889_1 /TAXON_ID=73025 ORGANISM="Eutreptiella gymnastica-like, Strain CCMP1594" /NCGR_SAMPLE_ID=MMETSP0811_2 /ASSEMBLY_ACC=CAM_ASM_000667 /LENGTH=187 /DNA_ID=CAMNT_0015510811 /DNA_START=43 /DNA_END=606 /DNA_ORIENTATION=+
MLHMVQHFLTGGYLRRGQYQGQQGQPHKPAALFNQQAANPKEEAELRVFGDTDKVKKVWLGLWTRGRRLGAQRQQSHLERYSTVIVQLVDHDDKTGKLGAQELLNEGSKILVHHQLRLGSICTLPTLKSPPFGTTQLSGDGPVGRGLEGRHHKTAPTWVHDNVCNKSTGRSNRQQQPEPPPPQIKAK